MSTRMGDVIDVTYIRSVDYADRGGKIDYFPHPDKFHERRWNLY
jgi:hypothetical protein